MNTNFMGAPHPFSPPKKQIFPKKIIFANCASPISGPNDTFYIYKYDHTPNSPTPSSPPKSTMPYNVKHVDWTTREGGHKSKKIFFLKTLDRNWEEVEGRTHLKRVFMDSPRPVGYGYDLKKIVYIIK